MTKKLISLLIALVMLATPFSTLVSAEEAAPYAIMRNEEESNDTFATAQSIYSDYTVIGSIRSLTDSDYYKITVGIDGCINFWLGNIPSACDYELEIYNSEQELWDCSLSANNYEEILAMPVSAGDVFYIRIYSFAGYNDSEEGKYTLRARVYLPSYNYYTQVENHNLSYTELQDIFSSNYIYNWQEVFYDEGCAVASCAMVLSNLGAKTTSLVDDIPNATGTSIEKEYLDASPFTVMMANTYNQDATVSGSNYIVPSIDYPVSCDYISIANLHGVRQQQFWPDGNEKEMVVNLLSACPQGICLYFDSDGSGDNGATHMVVVTSTTLEAERISMLALSTIYESYLSPTKTSEMYNQNTRSATRPIIALDDGDKFTVYDPYFTGTNASAGVSLADSYAGNTFDWYDLYYIVVFY